LSKCIFSERGIGFHGGTQQGRQRIDNGCGPVSNIAWATQDSTNDRENVCCPIGGHSVQREVPFSGASDFAGVGKKLAVSIDSSTIAGDNNFLFSSHYGDRCSTMERILGKCVTSEYKKSNQPRSVRHRHLSARTTHVGPIVTGSKMLRTLIPGQLLQNLFPQFLRFPKKLLILQKQPVQLQRPIG